MSRPIIEVSGLSKVYRLGEIGALSMREELAGMWARFRQRTPQTFAKDYWALRDVSFDVQPGEVIGVIGRNGAGKSTLLKVLSRITEPTSGRAVLRGRVASLLEVGTGFHPDLSGRDNIYLNGAILGMKRAEIRRKFDEIVAFAEIEKFIDTPVKRYSSGMYVRLAFAVAAHLEPEILIVDEVLAVGDLQFQKKCLGKMNEVAHRGGRTILFVSHNMVAVRALCQRGVMLSQGQVAAIGPIGEVTEKFVRNFAAEVMHRKWADSDRSSGTDAFRFREMQIVPRGEQAADQLTVASTFDLEFVVQAMRAGTINLSIEVRLLDGDVAFVTASPSIALRVGEVTRLRCTVPGRLLNSDNYAISAMIVEDGRALFISQDALVFEVHDEQRSGSWLGKWPGVVRPDLPWSHRMESAEPSPA